MLVLVGLVVWWWQDGPSPSEGFERVRGLGTVAQTQPLRVRTSTPPVMAEAVREGLTVQGLVHNGAGNPETGAEVRGCGRLTTTDGLGRFSLVVSPGDCLLHAVRVDGMLPVEGPRVPVIGSSGEVVSVLLSLPEYPQGFAGVFLGIGSDASQVASVAPGSKAAAEGVEPGHVVLAIDGVDVTHMGAEALWGRIQGDAGTVVTLTLETLGGAIYEVDLPREVVGQ